jgi:hypothetical protein
MPAVVYTTTSRDNPTFNPLQGIDINGMESTTSRSLDGVHDVDSAFAKCLWLRAFDARFKYV